MPGRVKRAAPGAWQQGRDGPLADVPEHAIAFDSLVIACGLGGGKGRLGADGLTATAETSPAWDRWAMAGHSHRFRLATL